MKKLYSLLLMLTLLCMTWATRAQQTLTIYEEGTATNRYVPAYVYYFDDFTRSQFVIPATSIGAMSNSFIQSVKFYTTDNNIPYTSESVVDVYLKEVDYTTISDFEPKSSATIVYSGTLTFVSTDDGGEVTITFTSPFYYNGGNLLIGIENTIDLAYKNIYFYGEEVTGASIAGSNANSLDNVTPSDQDFLPKTTFVYIPNDGSYCAPPTNLNVIVNGVDGSVNWASNVTLFDLEFDGVEYPLISLNTFPFSGLEWGTTYEVKVRAHCENGISDWATTTFTTAMCHDYEQCPITLELTDSYGDGWTGNVIRVVDALTGNVLGSFANTSDAGANETQIYTLDVCHGRDIEFVWVSGGSYSYPNEASFTIKDINDEIICQHIKDDNGPTAGSLCSYTMNCTPSTCLKPTNLAVSEVGPHSATLTWDATLPSFEISVNGTVMPVNLPGMETYSYTLENLDPETSYEVKVRTDCGGEEYSNWAFPVSFTTLVACPTPTDITLTEAGPQSAMLSWTGYSDSYNVRYSISGSETPRFFEDFENGLDNWTIYTEGDIPTDQTDGWHLYEPSNLDDDYTAISGSYAASAWSWSNNSAYDADNWLITPQIELGGTLKFWVFVNSNYPDSYEVLLSTGSNTISDFSVTLQPMAPAPTSGWTQVSIDLSNYASQTGYIAIHHVDYDKNYLFIDDFGVYDMAWINSSSTSTNNTTLVGLTPETTYEVQVQSNCGSDGISNWSEIFSFSTTEACPAPSNFVVSNIQATSATLDWTGYGDSYNVVYGDFHELPLQYDDDEIYTTIGSSTSGTWSWAVMYPISTIPSLNQLTSISFYELAAYNTEDFTVRIYSGGDDEPGTLLHEETVSPMGTDGFHEITFETPVQLIPGENLWISLTETGTYVMPACLNDNPNNKWVYYETYEQWVPVNYLMSALADYGWMIRATISDGSSEATVWTPMGASTNHLVLTGLNPGTIYAVQAQSECGSDGTSDWSEPFFFVTETSVCAVPTNIEYSNVTRTSFDLTWDAGEASAWQIMIDGDEANLIDVTTNFHTVTGLTPFTVYAVQVRALCGEGDASAWSTLQSILTNEACVAPTNIGVLEAGQHEAEVYWWSEDSEYNTVRYRPRYAGYWDELDEVSSPTPLTELIPGTEYEVIVSANCGEFGESVWSSPFYFFTAPSTCYPPTDLDYSDVTRNSAVLSWTDNSGSSIWQIMVNNDEDNIMYVNENPYLLEGLTPETGYTVKVRAYCGEGDESDWSEVTFMTDVACPIPSDLAVSNISYDAATVSWSSEENVRFRYKAADGVWQTYDFAATPLVLDELQAGTEYYVQVQSVCGSITSDWVQETFTTLPCPAPTGLTVLDQTNNSVTLGWTANGDETTWNLYYMRAGQYPFNQIEVTENPFTLTDLLSGFDYQFYVEAVCSENTTSDASPILTYSMVCMPESIPYSYDFEDDDLFACWNLISGTVLRTPGMNALRFAGGMENMVALPDFEETINNLQISFFARPTSNSTLDRSGVLKVGYMTDITDASSFVAVKTYHNYEWTDNIYEQRIVSFPDAPAGARIAFLHNPIDADWAWLIDNVVVSEAVFCDAPTSLTATNVTKNSAVLNWTETGEATAWQIMVNNDEEHIIDVTVKPYTLTGLTPETDYAVKVRANCGEGSVNAWSAEKTFSTGLACPAVTDLTLVSATSTTATMSWSGEGDYYNIKYVTGSHEWTTINNVTPPYTLTGLESLTNYEVRVQSVCDDIASDWSNSEFISTESCPVPGDVVFSDVTRNSAVVSWTAIGEAAAWQIMIDDDEETIVDVTENSYTLTGLTLSTTYNVKVRTNCGTGATSMWVTRHLTTESCHAPADLAVSNITNNSATVTWTADGESSNVRYKMNTGDWIVLENVATPMVLSGLQAETYYYVQVQNVCDGIGSNWCDAAYFHTEACPIPTNLSVLSQTNQSVTIGWTPGGDETVWNLYYALANHTYTKIAEVTENPYTVTGLHSGFDYNFYVEAVCDPTSISSHSSTLAYSMVCMPEAIPYSYDFEDENLFACWNPKANTANIFTDDNHTVGGSHCLEFLNSTSNMVSLPAFEEEISNLQISFWSRPYQVDASCGDLTVGYMTDITDASSFVPVKTYHYDDWNAVMFEQHTVSFPDAPAGARIAFRHTPTSESWTWYMDDVEVTPTVFCDAPTNLVVNNITKNSAVLTWTETGEATAWQIMVNNNEENIIDVTENPYTLTDLNAETDYTVKVRSNCGEGSINAWSTEKTFTTDLACPATTDLTVTNVTSNSATLTWTGDGDSYNFRYRIGDDAWQMTEDVNPTLTLTGLQSNASYEAQIQNICNGVPSEWSNVEPFTTAACPAPSGLTITSITMTSAVVNWTETGEATAWQIMVNNDEENIINVTENPYTLTELNIWTDYTVKVRANCGGFTSGWSTVQTFSTLPCAPESIPYTYDFEEAAPYNCWKTLAGHSEIRNQVVTSHEGTHMLALTESNDNLVVLPEFEEEISNLQISFWARPHSYNINDYTSTDGTLSVGYVINPNDPSTFVPVNTYNTEWVNSVLLEQKLETFENAPAGSHIAFRQNSTSIYGTWYVDDVLVSTVCTVPTGITVTPTNISATVTWNDNGDDVTWELAFDGMEFGINGIISTPTNEYERSGLQPETNHYVILRTNCGEGVVSKWSEPVYFTTLPNVIPSYINIIGDTVICEGSETELTAETDVPATFSWDHGENTATITVPAGTYTVTVTTSTNHTLSRTVTVTEKMHSTTSIIKSICENEMNPTYIWDGITFYEAGTKQVSYYNASVNGCDSIVTMTLIVNSLPDVTIDGETVICQGESTTLTADGATTYEWSNDDETAATIVTTAGTYTVVGTDNNNCSNTAEVTVTVNELPNVTISGETAFCQGSNTTLTAEGAETYEWSNDEETAAITVDASGIYTVTGIAANGCQNTAEVTVTVNALPNITINGETVFCQGGNTTLTASGANLYLWNTGSFEASTTVTTGGTYTVIGTDANNCHNSTSVTVTANPLPNVTISGATAFCAGSNTTLTAEGAVTYEWSNDDETAATTVTAAGTYTVIGTDANNCQNSAEVTVSVNPLPNVTINGVTAFCQGSNTTLTADGAVTYEWSNDEETAATTVTTAGTYTVVGTDANNCQNSAEVTVTVNELPDVTISGVTTFCQGESSVLIAEGAETYEWSNDANTAATTVTTAGTYTVVGTDVNGCENTAEVTVTVNELPNVTISGDSTFCEDGSTTLTAYGAVMYEWSNEDQTAATIITAADTYTVTGTDANGCENTAEVTVIINMPSFGTEVVTACDTFTWHGTTYTESTNTPTFTLTNAAGCDSVVTLNLTINHSSTGVEEVTACDSYTWHGTTYNTSGEYQFTLDNAAGCDSVVTLHLTINHSSTGSEEATACDSYTWHGTTYNASGEYQFTLENAAGCDSVVTLHLTINHSNTGVDVITACETYTWIDGQTYTSSTNTPTFTLTNAAGCDSVVTLNLTISHSVATEFTYETSDSCYEWNGEVYCNSGDYTQTLSTAAGCDSVVTLHLTTSVGIENHEVAIVYLAPNPAKNICRIMGLEAEPVTVDLFDMSGKLVMRERDVELDVTTLPTGIYMVKVSTGNRVINLKMVKQ